MYMYVDEKIPYNMRNDLNELNNLKDTETLFIEIEKQKSKNIVIGVIYIYRPPDQNMKEFNKSIDTLLSKIAGQEKKLLYIMGDFNINLLNNEIYESTGEFVDILSFILCLQVLLNRLE